MEMLTLESRSQLEGWSDIEFVDTALGSVRLCDFV